MEHEIFIRDVIVIDKKNSIMVRPGETDAQGAPDVSDKNLDSFFKRALKAAARIYDKPVLVTQTDVTHYGYVNANFRRYQLEFIKANAKTWTKDYNKPVQINHSDHDVDDTIGRVLFAVPVIYKQTAAQKESLTIPSGHITVYSAVSDEVGIEKIMDGRYLTVSMGARSTHVTCSICGRHPMSWECEHRLGKSYDIEVEGKKKQKNVLAYANFGAKEYQEYSYITVPADKRAKTARYEMTDESVSALDMINKEIGKFEVPGHVPTMKFFFGEKSRTMEIVSSLQDSAITDSGNSPDVLLYDFKGIEELDVSVETDTKTESQTTETPNIETEQEDTTGDVGTGSEVSPKDSSDEEESTEEQEDTMAKKYAVLHLIHNLLSADNVDVADAIAELATIDVKIVGDKLTKEQVVATLDTLLNEMEAEDAKKDEKDRVLTTKIRKKLAPATFCGSDRSWPVPDCQHVSTARSFLAQASKTKNLSATAKAKIRACVDRRAKALGCDKSKKGDNDEMTFASVEEMLNSVPVARAIDELLSEKEGLINDLEGKLIKLYLGQILDYGKRLEKSWDKDEKKKAAYVARLKVREIDSLEDTLDDLRVEAGEDSNQDSKNNDKLDQATNATDTDTDGNGDTDGNNTNADETITNPEEKNNNDKPQTTETGSVLANSGAIK